MWFTCRHQQKRILSCEILTMTMLDHAPVELTIVLDTSLPRSLHWRFNLAVFQYSDYEICIKEPIDDFWQLNARGETDLATCWDALKVYLRGNSMSFWTNSLKEFRKREAEL